MSWAVCNARSQSYSHDLQMSTTSAYYLNSLNATRCTLFLSVELHVILFIRSPQSCRDARWALWLNPWRVMQSGTHLYDIHHSGCSSMLRTVDSIFRLIFYGCTPTHQSPNIYYKVNLKSVTQYINDTLCLLTFLFLLLPLFDDV